jgi:hypothetical protein
MATGAPKKKASIMANSNGNGRWLTPTALIAVIVVIGSVAAFTINGVDAASSERTKALKDYVFREMELRGDGISKRLDSIERKIDQILADK